PDDAARAWAEEPGIEAEDVLLAVPRAALFVPQLALRVAFLPLRGLVWVVDEYRLVQRYESVFFSDDGTRGVLPTFGFQSGYGFSAGLSYFDTDLFDHDEELHLSARFGGRFLQRYEAAFEGAHVGGSALWLDLLARYESQPALYFYGLGDAGDLDGAAPAGGFDPRAGARATRYREDRVLGVVHIGGTFGDPGRPSVAEDVDGWERGTIVRLGASFVMNARDFGGESREYDEPSIEAVYDTARLPGFRGGSTSVEALATLIVDTRDNEGRPSRGAFVQLLGGGAVPGVDGPGWWHAGGEVSGWLDLSRGDRVLMLRAMMEGVVGDDADIPFSDLPRLGGPNRLRGYDDGRFRDKVAAMASVAYFYPVHEMVSGELFFDGGRVARTVGDALDVDAWHFGGGLGLVIGTEDDVLFRLEVSYGEAFLVTLSTSPFEAFDEREE
ncbi:MAG: BamA/TamA family outer membrane protein, partial [Myxococcales bacterium]|nr:BamA/TamA family outer membrane protein [Myxococcales bacterium]